VAPTGAETSPASDERPGREALREATLTGVRWISLARVGCEIMAFGTMVWLAHLMAPADFGRAAVALIVNALAIVVAGGGFGTPLVQRRTIEQAHLESAQLASLACGAILTLATLLAAPLVCDPLFDEETTRLVQLMSPVFVIASLGVVSQSVLQRRLDFRRLSVVEMASVAAASLSSLALAAGGLNAEALVGGALVAAATLSVLQQACTPLVLPRWRGPELREIVAFGVPSALSSLVGMVNRNVDYAILAAKLAPAQVGFYWRAFQFGIEHQRKVSGILMRIALPVYARADNAEHRREIRRRIVRTQATVVFPLLATFIALAPALLPWLLGERWEPAVVPAQILAVGGMAVSVLTGLGPLMLAAGRPRALLAYNLASTAVFALTVLLVAPLGLHAVCLAATGFYVMQVLAAHWLLLDRLLGIPTRQVVGDVAPAGVSSAALVAVSMPLARALEEAGLPVLALLALTTVVAGAVYLLVVRLAFRAAWSDLALVARRVLGRRQPQRESAAVAPATG
jgi:lipopolysaccharide exporter